MNLPKAIDDCRLIETIVEIRFVPAPEVERALLAGMLTLKLKEAGYVYRKVPPLNVAQEGDRSIRLTIDKSGDEGGASVFENEEERVRLLVDGTTIAFNCIGTPYIGWERYRIQVERVMEILEEAKAVASYERTMIRFINEFEDNILDHVNIDVHSRSGDHHYDTLEVRLSRQEDDAVAFISISGKRERVSNLTKERRETSLFDVNVFCRLPEGSGMEEAMESLEKIHRIEKESFFGLLKDDYLTSLNPV